MKIIIIEVAFRPVDSIPQHVTGVTKLGFVTHYTNTGQQSAGASMADTQPHTNPNVSQTNEEPNRQRKFKQLRKPTEPHAKTAA